MNKLIFLIVSIITLFFTVICYANYNYYPINILKDSPVLPWQTPSTNTLDMPIIPQQPYHFIAYISNDVKCDNPVSVTLNDKEVCKLDSGSTCTISIFPNATIEKQTLKIIKIPEHFCTPSGTMKLDFVKD